MRIIRYIIIFCAAVIPCIGVAQTETDTLVVGENFDGETFFCLPTASSRARMVSSSHRGTVLYNEPLFPNGATETEKEMARTSLSNAAHYWGNYLDGDTITLNVSFDSSITNDIQTEVIYQERDNTGYPLSLQSRLFGLRPADVKDAYIKIKDISAWQTGFERNGKKNLTLALMRAIATSMGFGASVYQKTDRNGNAFVTLPCNSYSLSDSLVSTLGNKKLSDIYIRRNRANDELESYVTSGYGTPYLMTESNNYKLYAPTTFENGASMRFLDEAETLMSAQLPDSMEISVDDVTKELLNAIGWSLANETSSSGISIVCAGADSIGYASAYIPLTFSLTGNTNNITSYHWVYELKKNNGNMDTLAVAYTPQLVVGSVEDESAFYADEEGCLVGRVTFTGTTADGELQTHYSLRLEIKPRVLSVIISEPSPCIDDEDYFDVDVDVRYVGSNYLYLTYRQEYIPLLVGKYSHIPSFAHFKLKHLDAWGYVDIAVKAMNGYGATIVQRNIPAQLDEDALFSPRLISAEVKYSYIDLFDESGYPYPVDCHLKTVFETQDTQYVTYLCQEQDMYGEWNNAFYGYCPVMSQGRDTVNIEIPCDIFERYCFYSHRGNMQSSPLVIDVNDLITDTAARDSLGLSTVGIASKATRNATVRFDGRRIIVDGVEDIVEVRLYNGSGRPVSHSFDGKCIIPAEPVSGLLILRMNTNSGVMTRSFVAK